MSRAYYSASLDKFLNDNSDSILGELTRQHQFALEDLQRNAWISQIQILKNELFLDQMKLFLYQSQHTFFY